MNRSRTVGIPSFRTPPSGVGISTRVTGCGWYVPDRRDARPRARLLRSGDLTPVSGPTREDATMRDLSRAREEAIRDLNAATYRLKAFLRRPHSRSTGQATGGPAHRRGLSAVVCATPAPQIVFQEDRRAVTAPPEPLQRPLVPRFRFRQRLSPGVEWLNA